MSKLIKHSAAIQLSGSLTLAQRQCYNALLKNAFPWMKRGEDHWIQTRDLERLLHKEGARNRAWLIETVESLRDVPVRYNVLGKDRDHREQWDMHSGLFAEVGTNSTRELIQYSFPNTLIDLLSNPQMYAKINLDFQARFRGHYGLPLYEFYLDILGGKRRSVSYTFWLEDLRRLLCLENKYREYRRLAEKVIRPAHREICQYTDMHVEITEVLRRNRSVVGIEVYIERTDPAVIATARDNGAATGPLMNRLQTIYDRETAAIIMNRYEVDYIQAQLDYFTAQKGRIRIDNPGGYLRAALQTDYADYRGGRTGKGGDRDEQPEHKTVQPPGITEDHIRERQRKEADARWRDYRSRVLNERYAEFDEEEQAALQVRFEASQDYEDNRQVLRSGRSSGFYRRIYETWLLRELCPEQRFHDLETYLEWEAGGEPAPPGDESE